MNVITETTITDIPLFKRGKVRDVYDLGEMLLFIATDRISAFDVVLTDAIPQKGEVLTQISLFWFKRLSSIVPNHVIEWRVENYPPELKPYADQLRGRSMIVKKTSPLPIECVVRGYISGSGWKEYQRSQSVCGIPLPGGLIESSKLSEAIFTPSTKAESGMHDENITFDEVTKIVGAKTAATIRDLSLALYKSAAEYAESRGIIIADTKFEFGIDPSSGEIILIDELLTPDSSRFWPADQYCPGKPQPSFDKQFVRDYLESIHWDKKPPAPKLPDEVIERTTEKYLEAYERLVGKELRSRDTSV
ncbi:MAG: phosphoribosylaminoimidazolesuccinocarboxamide synthase [Bacteroidota bacterium]